MLSDIIKNNKVPLNLMFRKWKLKLITSSEYQDNLAQQQGFKNHTELVN